MNRRITISCLAVTVTFFVCWAPDEILFFIRSLSTLGIDVNFNKAVLKAVYYVGLFNCTLNPVLYAFFNPNYRKAFMYLKNLKLFFQSTKDENKSIITAFSSFSAAADDDAVINREFQTTYFYFFLLLRGSVGSIGGCSICSKRWHGFGGIIRSKSLFLRIAYHTFIHTGYCCSMKEF